jgi:hypothetical protein
MSVLEMIRKSMLASLGAAVVTKEKVEEATKRWVDEGKIPKMKRNGWHMSWWRVAGTNGKTFRTK